ncbi:MAG: CubicO group peptidase (beta-lactamase class C family), partial [Granulosicoccus sp.]
QLSYEICRSCEFTAVGIGVLKSGNAPLVSVAGHRYEKSEFPVGRYDPWHIGSITKSITSTLIADQISYGKYDFETPIASVLDHIPIHPSKNKITVKQLLTHTAKLQANY